MDVHPQGQVTPVKHNETPQKTFFNSIAPTEDELRILNKVSAIIPTLTVTDFNKTTSAKNSRASIFNPRQKYCTGETLTVQIEMFDYLGNKKTYGGDFIKAKIFSANLKAGATGKVEDLNNGMYHINFTLSWEGKVYVSLVLHHSSEAVSALWRARNHGYGLVYFIGTFVNGTRQVKTECGFQLNGTKDVCEYRYEKENESYFCTKVENFDCGSLSYLQSFNKDLSFLSSLEKILVQRENIAVAIQKDFEYIDVSTCARTSSAPLEQCKIGMDSPLPSGFVLKNVWNPVFCQIKNFSTPEQMYTCLQDKMIYILGDSTLRQWFYTLTGTFKGLKTFNLHRSGLESLLIAADHTKNILLYWKKHSHPFVASHFYTVKDNAYMSQEIDQLAGGPHYVLVICLGQHFRLFPIHLFIRRVLNVYKAVERLLIRSPDTKVIIKTENAREVDSNAERLSDFHGYIQNLIVMETFSNLRVAWVDAWDMSIAYNTNNVHLPELVIRNQILMFLTYIC
ncbi:NXPE family member 2-like [Pyxicephalus adspersus]|uniref:NXPE family member 2-like n=1 Tax=Pyxicephalus adspersus TaxID=30357 RepID=UPI003B5C4AA9